ncbi:MAG: agmatine deiminase family protein [Terrimicrobiaceae bacterium]|nr:agmatine deiminase family protein [Terrimicrobiaceae bacterium]
MTARHTPAPAQTMPAEWEPHEATWISWPHPECNSFPGSYQRVIPTFVRMAEALSESEIVRINVRDSEEEKWVRGLLRNAPPERLEFFGIPTDEPWCRDHGPIFVRRGAGLAVLNFGFNAWGYKLSPFDSDDEVPGRVAEALGLPLLDHGDFILEGGSIDVNGAGSVLTTESCLLNPNRNPKLDRAAIEKKLRETLGVKQVLWLGDGIEGDDTDGHVDDITRFVSPTTVVTTIEEDESDPNHEPLQANLDRLRAMQLSSGEALHVLTIPMPSRIVRENIRLPASYANFYIANSVVLLPVYGERNDAWAESVLREVFPTRKIIPIDCRELIWGLGAFHCLTQQQPAA